MEGMDYTNTSLNYLLGSVFMKRDSGTIISRTDEYGNWTEKRSYEHKECFGKVE